MRSRDHLMKVLAVVGSAAAMLLISAPSAGAQILPSPNATPTVNRAGFVWFMAIGGIVLGLVIALLVVTAYMRFAPRFQREEGPRSARVPRVGAGGEAPRRPVNITGAPVVVPAPVAPAPAAATASAAPAPAPAAAPAPASGAPAPAPAAATASAAPAPAPAAERKEVALDQEVFDKTLEELLGKGTSRRVAEGQARRAAMIAARKKAAEG